MNKVILAGRVYKDFELKSTQSGLEVTSLLLKCFNDNTQKNYITIECTFWGDNAKNVYESVSEGSYIEVEGKLANSQYTRKDGTNINKIYVSVEKFEIVEEGLALDNDEAPTQSYEKPQPKEEKLSDYVFDDPELPF